MTCLNANECCLRLRSMIRDISSEVLTRGNDQQRSAAVNVYNDHVGEGAFLGNQDMGRTNPLLAQESAPSPTDRPPNCLLISKIHPR
jgi:hypothetical protein